MKDLKVICTERADLVNYIKGAERNTQSFENLMKYHYINIFSFILFYSKRQEIIQAFYEPAVDEECDIYVYIKSF
jgi:hypothetical protein